MRVIRLKLIIFCRLAITIHDRRVQAATQRSIEAERWHSLQVTQSDRDKHDLEALKA